MEYKDFLGGIAKGKLDKLDMFKGKFFIGGSKLKVKRKRKILSAKKWESPNSKLKVKRKRKILSAKKWESIKSRLPTDIVDICILSWWQNLFRKKVVVCQIKAANRRHLFIEQRTGVQHFLSKTSLEKENGNFKMLTAL